MWDLETKEVYRVSKVGCHFWSVHFVGRARSATLNQYRSDICLDFSFKHGKKNPTISCPICCLSPNDQLNFEQHVINRDNRCMWVVCGPKVAFGLGFCCRAWWTWLTYCKSPWTDIHRPLLCCDDTVLCHHTTSRQQQPLFPVWGSSRSTPQRMVSVCPQSSSLLSSKTFFCSRTMSHLLLFHRRQVRQDGKDKNSVVSFTLTDEPRHVDLVPSNSKEEVRRQLVIRTTPTLWSKITYLLIFIYFYFFHRQWGWQLCVKMDSCIFLSTF